MTDRPDNHPKAAPQAGSGLSDEAFSDLLLLPEDRVQGFDHLTDASRGEIGDVRSALAAYRSESLHWAERRSAAEPPLAARARRMLLLDAAPRWALAATAVVTLAAGVMHLAGNGGTTGDASQGGADSSAQLAAPHASSSEILEDNHLLSSIDQALSARSVSAKDFGLEEADASHDAPRPPTPGREID
jgi:hypothetical protein